MLYGVISGLLGHGLVKVDNSCDFDCCESIEAFKWEVSDHGIDIERDLIYLTKIKLTEKMLINLFTDRFKVSVELISSLLSLHSFALKSSDLLSFLR